MIIRLLIAIVIFVFLCGLVRGVYSAIAYSCNYDHGEDA